MHYLLDKEQHFYKYERPLQDAFSQPNFHR